MCRTVLGRSHTATAVQCCTCTQPYTGVRTQPAVQNVYWCSCVLSQANSTHTLPSAYSRTILQGTRASRCWSQKLLAGHTYRNPACVLLRGPLHTLDHMAMQTLATSTSSQWVSPLQAQRTQHSLKRVAAQFELNVPRKGELQRSSRQCQVVAAATPYICQDCG